MDCGKVGALLLRLRKEKSLTQKQVAERLNLSDKTISKWERGLGCPDVNVLDELSNLFEVNIEGILQGDLEANRADAGNLRRVRFYVCRCCGNVIHATGNASVSCCGRRLSPLAAKPADGEHAATVEDSDGSAYLTFAHGMQKDHFISFVAYVAGDKLLFVRLYPEQDAAVILPQTTARALSFRHSRQLYFYCTVHGLFQY